MKNDFSPLRQLFCVHITKEPAATHEASLLLASNSTVMLRERRATAVPVRTEGERPGPGDREWLGQHDKADGPGRSPGGVVESHGDRERPACMLSPPIASVGGGGARLSAGRSERSSRLERRGQQLIAVGV